MHDCAEQVSFCGKGLSDSCGPELVWYGPANTYCIKVILIRPTS